MSLADRTFVHPFGSLQLRRWPRLSDDPLRGWDGADRYLLEALAEELPQVAPLLVLNDQSGALTLALVNAADVYADPANQLGCQVYASGDSFVAYAALLANAQDNGIDPARLSWSWADQPLPGGAKAVLLRVPKELSLLEWQLAALSQALPAGVPLLIAGMDKHLPRNLVEVLGRYLDAPSAGLGRHKARIFRARIAGHAKAPPPPSWLTLPEQGWQLRVDAGVFSRQQLDIGARFFLEHIPHGIDGDICDLGCGNGVIGMMALQQNPLARLCCCDESALALTSARDNIARTFPDRQVQFYLGNGLDGLDQQFDLVLLNPPFHRGHALDDSVTRMLFRHARRHLKSGGVVRVIGNSHLGYGALLKDQFGKVSQVARNAKFIIYDAGL
ncbi:MAG: methyltransferase [Alcanivoracaceae bacterium]|nr:methyltransferase [Alcanivoracaceae bacterium]